MNSGKGEQMSRQRSMEVIEQAEYVTIGELVRLTAVRYSTLKFYTEEGMLPFEQAERTPILKVESGWFSFYFTHYEIPYR